MSLQLKDLEVGGSTEHYYATLSDGRSITVIRTAEGPHLGISPAYEFFDPENDMYDPDLPNDLRNEIIKAIDAKHPEKE